MRATVFALAVSLAAAQAVTDAEQEKLNIASQADRARSAFTRAYQTEAGELTAEYPKFAEQMNDYKYKWEAFDVKSSDGYDLTMFRIVGKNGYEWYKPSRPEHPVLIMNGFMADGTSWFEIGGLDFGNSKNAPLPTALFDAGFDVFIGNPRGSPQSNKANDSSVAYWDFGLDGLNEDVKAFISSIKTATENENATINYVGMNVGNTQMFYGLANGDAALKKDIHKFVALTPCVTPAKWALDTLRDETGAPIDGDSYMTTEILRDGLIANFQSYPNTYGPGYSSSFVMQSLGPRFYSTSLSYYGEENFNPLYSEASSGVRPISNKLWIHLLEAGINQRLGVWDEAYMTDPVGTELTAVDLSKVDVPVSLLFGGAGALCPADTNMEALDKLPNVERKVKYDNLGDQNFYRTDPEILADVITILGSGAYSLVAAATALTMLSAL